MRFDVSSQHPRTPNYLLESDQLGFDEDLLTSWQVFLRAEGKSPVTIKGYLASVGRLVAFTRAQGMPSITNLTREHVAAWMDWMRSAANKPATIHTRYRGASAFYKWLIMEADDTPAPRTDFVLEPARHDTEPYAASALPSTSRGGRGIAPALPGSAPRGGLHRLGAWQTTARHPAVQLRRRRGRRRLGASPLLRKGRDKRAPPAL